MTTRTFRMLSLAALSAFLLAGCTEAGGAELADRYREIGRVEAEVDGTPHTLLVLDDLEKGRSALQVREVMGMRTATISASGVRDDGRPGAPYLILSIRTGMGREDTSLTWTERRGTTDFYESRGGAARPVTVEAAGDDGVWSGRFSAELTRSGEEADDPRPRSVTVSGTFRVRARAQ